MLQSLYSITGGQYTENGTRYEELGGDPLGTWNHFPHHADVSGRSYGSLGCQGRTRGDVSTLDTMANRNLTRRISSCWLKASFFKASQRPLKAGTSALNAANNEPTIRNE